MGRALRLLTGVTAEDAERELGAQLADTDYEVRATGIAGSAHFVVVYRNYNHIGEKFFKGKRSYQKGARWALGVIHDHSAAMKALGSLEAGR